MSGTNIAQKFVSNPHLRSDCGQHRGRTECTSPMPQPANPSQLLMGTAKTGPQVRQHWPAGPSQPTCKMFWDRELNKVILSIAHRISQPAGVLRRTTARSSGTFFLHLVLVILRIVLVSQKPSKKHLGTQGEQARKQAHMAADGGDLNKLCNLSAKHVINRARELWHTATLFAMEPSRIAMLLAEILKKSKNKFLVKSLLCCGMFTSF